MKKVHIQIIVAVCGIITFIIPLIQLSIGFHFIVRDGTDANIKCQAAPDLPLLLAIGGIFALFFLGLAYGFFKMLSTVDDQQSDMAGNAPRILLGLISFMFGSITFIFFILTQMRVYASYSNGVQFNTRPASTYCDSTIMRGALAMVILTYISIILFIVIFIIVLINTQRKRKEKEVADIEMTTTNINSRH